MLEQVEMGCCRKTKVTECLYIRGIGPQRVSFRVNFFIQFELFSFEDWKETNWNQNHILWKIVNKNIVHFYTNRFCFCSIWNIFLVKLFWNIRPNIAIEQIFNKIHSNRNIPLKKSRSEKAHFQRQMKNAQSLAWYLKGT